MLIPKELINEAKSKLNSEAAHIIAKDLNIENWMERDLKGSCPLGHSDSTPSFIYNSKENCFHCFSCGRNYGIIDHYISFYGLTFLGAVEKLFEQTKISYRFGEKGIKTDRDYRYPKYDSIETRKNVEEYLQIRAISAQTLDYCDIREDIHKNIVFNYYDTNDVLTLVKYRPSRKVRDNEPKMWCQKDSDTKHLLFNMNRIDPTKPLLIVEGELDCLSVIESGFKNCVSIPLGAQNTQWVTENFDWLEEFEKIIIWFDNDVPGINARKETCSRLGTWRTYYIELPKKLDKEGNLVSVKDANEVLYHFGSQKILDILDTAQEIPISNVIDLADIPDFDIESAPGIFSSSKELGNYIYKYLLGTLLILTGRNGNGKSVFLNQEFVVEPLNQGKSVYIYSGEMGKPILKSWIELVLSGRDNVQLVNNTIHRIKPETKKLMQEWYKDKIFVYDNDKDLTADSILDRFETVVRRYGVTVGIFDNLLTIDLPVPQGSDIWQEQKKFVVRLINFASKFNVFIVLVAHPKKTVEFRRLTSDDVGGPGAITNLSHYVLSIHRYTKKEKEGIKNKKGGYTTEPEKHDCVIDLFKNRITGHANKEVKQYFDYLSYRFYNTPEELWKRYGWDKRTTAIPSNDPNDHELLPDSMKD